MRLFDFGRNYAKNYASIICQGLTHCTESSVTDYNQRLTLLATVILGEAEGLRGTQYCYSARP